MGDSTGGESRASSGGLTGRGLLLLVLWNVVLLSGEHAVGDVADPPATLERSGDGVAMTAFEMFCSLIIVMLVLSLSPAKSLSSELDRLTRDSSMLFVKLSAIRCVCCRCEAMAAAVRFCCWASSFLSMAT